MLVMVDGVKRSAEIEWNKYLLAYEHPEIVKRRLECIQSLFRRCPPGGRRTEMDLRGLCIMKLYLPFLTCITFHVKQECVLALSVIVHIHNKYIMTNK